jgi:hypothetical protein
MLFTDALNYTVYAPSNERIIVNNELESVWKETVLT